VRSAQRHQARGAIGRIGPDTKGQDESPASVLRGFQIGLGLAWWQGRNQKAPMSSIGLGRLCAAGTWRPTAGLRLADRVRSAGFT